MLMPMKMAELETRTGVHRETIRVYLRHGLLPAPDRPRKNVAVYTDQHVEAIMAVQRLQRENRLTLPEIGKMLKGVAPGHGVEASAFSQLEQLLATRVGYDEHLVTVKSLRKQSEFAVEDAVAMDRLGIIAIVKDKNNESLSITDAQLVILWGRMRDAGFAAELNFVPEMLGFYQQAAEFVAGWEAKTFFERTDGKVEVNFAASMLEAALPLMLNFFGLLRMKAFMRNIDLQKPQSPGEKAGRPVFIKSVKPPSRIYRHADQQQPD